MVTVEALHYIRRVMVTAEPTHVTVPTLYTKERGRGYPFFFCNWMTLIPGRMRMKRVGRPTYHQRKNPKRVPRETVCHMIKVKLISGVSILNADKEVYCLIFNTPCILKVNRLIHSIKGPIYDNVQVLGYALQDGIDVLCININTN